MATNLALDNNLLNLVLEVSGDVENFSMDDITCNGGEK